MDDDRMLPVLASAPDARVLEARPEPLPLAAPAVAAAGGLIAGLGTFVLARVLRRGGVRTLLRRRRRRAGLEIVGTRSFLVDVHFVGRRSR